MHKASLRISVALAVALLCVIVYLTKPAAAQSGKLFNSRNMSPPEREGRSTQPPSGQPSRSLPVNQNAKGSLNR